MPEIKNWERLPCVHQGDKIIKIFDNDNEALEHAESLRKGVKILGVTLKNAPDIATDPLVNVLARIRLEGYKKGHKDGKAGILE